MSASISLAADHWRSSQRVNRTVHTREGVVNLPMPFELKSGRMLRKCRIAFRLVGDESLPVVLVAGGISAGRNFWRSDGDGWWQNQFGAGKAGDTDRFCFLGVDFLGGNGDSSGPANWGGCEEEFPDIDARDQARAIVAVLEHLGVASLHSAIAASYGGMVALQLAAGFGELVGRALVFCAAQEASPLATGWRHVQRRILDLGLRHDDASSAVGIARSLAMCTYRAEREFSRRFVPGGVGRASVSDYLDHCGETFSRRFNAHAYLCLSRSIDDHHVDPASISIPVDLVGFSSDQIVPVEQLIELRNRLGESGFLRVVDSIFGHDAFLMETGTVTRIIRKHLEERS